MAVLSRFRLRSTHALQRACLALLAAWALQAPAEDHPTQVAELVRQLQDGDPAAQVAAADRLGQLGEAAKPALPALLNAMTGKSSWVDIALTDALGELGPVALPFLLDRLQNGDKETRLRALRGLSRMGVRAAEALPMLRQLARDPDENVSRQALRNLQGIEADLAARTNGVPFRALAEGVVGGTNRPPAVPAAPGGDWPRFRGPRGDGLCAETNLLPEWPADGPRLLWRMETLGNGLSTVSIAGGRLFTTGDRGAGAENAQYVLAFDLATRAERWATRIGGAYAEHGALCTPTVDGESLYVTATDGGLYCLDTGTGAVRWQRHLAADFGGAMMSRWRWSESPLVDRDRVICTPGASNAVMVALDKRTGATVWKCAAPPLGSRGSDGAGYCSAAAAEIAGVRQYIQVVGRGVVAAAADSGRFLWGYNRLASTVANIPGPIVRGSEVFTANGYNTGAALLRIERQDDAFRAGEVYVLPPAVFQNHHGGFVLVGDYVYGGSGSNRGDPTCIAFASGKVMWKVKAPSPGSASVLYADGRVLFRYDRGLLVLVGADPSAYRVRGSFTPPRTDRAAWSYPVIHNRRLYLRDQHLLLCYDLRAAGG